MTITGYSSYIASAGELWDEIAFKMYQNERLAHYLIAANLRYIDVIQFEGGEELAAPIFDTDQLSQTLPPWRREV